MAACFQSLPAEVLTIILHDVATHRELVNLMIASSAAYRVFQGCPELLLRGRAESAFPSALLRDVAALYNAKTLFRPIRTLDEQLLAPQIAKAFLDDYFNPAIEFECPTSKPGWLWILRLSDIIHQFSDTFALSAIRESRALRRCLNFPFIYDSEEVTHVANISGTERFRLCRAFLRLEIYCTVFRVPRRRNEREWYTPRMPAPFFLNKLEEWEVEEMICLHEYYTSILSSIMYGTLQNFGQALDKARENCIEETGVELGNLFDLRRTRLSIYTRFEAATMDTRIRAMASLGLEFLFQLSQQERRIQFKMVRNRFFWKNRFYTIACCVSRYDPRPPSSPAWCLGSIKNPEVASPGYSRYRRSEWELNPFGIDSTQKAHPFRAMGTVFWDARTLDSPPIAGGLAAAAERSFRARYTPFTNIRLYDPVDGVIIKPSDHKRLEKQFGISWQGKRANDEATSSYRAPWDLERLARLGHSYNSHDFLSDIL